MEPYSVQCKKKKTICFHLSFSLFFFCFFFVDLATYSIYILSSDNNVKVILKYLATAVIKQINVTQRQILASFFKI